MKSIHPMMWLACASLAWAADTDWPVNGGAGNIRYSGLTQINRENVKQLQVAWTYDSGDAFPGSEMQSNPIVVDGTLYATTPKMRVIALDATSGREIWSFNPSEPSDPKRRFRQRGVRSIGIAFSSPIATTLVSRPEHGQAYSPVSGRMGRIDCARAWEAGAKDDGKREQSRRDL